MRRRPVFLAILAAALVLVPAAPAASASPKFDLDSADIPALQARMASGRLTQSTNSDCV